MSFAENGTVVAILDSIYVACNNVHILRTCDFASRQITLSRCAPVVTHADGSMVTSFEPAQPGEEVVIYAVGLGETDLSGMTGQPPSSPIRVPTAIGYDFRPNAGPSQPQFQIGYGLVPAISPVFSGMTPGSVGLYQINVIIPYPPKACRRVTSRPYLRRFLHHFQSHRQHRRRRWVRRLGICGSRVHDPSHVRAALRKFGSACSRSSAVAKCFGS